MPPCWGLCHHAPEIVDAFDRRIAALAADQYGYITRAQLLRAGTRRLRRSSTACRRGRLIPVHAGVYAVGHLPVGPVARAFAAVLACGPGALLSHGSAATLWGFNKYWDTPLEVTVVASQRRRPGIKIHRSRTLTDPDRDCQLGIPVTSPARTALDIAPRLADKRLIRVVNDGRHARVLHLDDLVDVLDRNPTLPGAKRLRHLAETQPDGPTRSELEDAFLAFAKRFALPTPSRTRRSTAARSTRCSPSKG